MSTPYFVNSLLPLCLIPFDTLFVIIDTIISDGGGKNADIFTGDGAGNGFCHTSFGVDAYPHQLAGSLAFFRLLLACLRPVADAHSVGIAISFQFIAQVLNHVFPVEEVDAVGRVGVVRARIASHHCCLPLSHFVVLIITHSRAFVNPCLC